MHLQQISIASFKRYPWIQVDEVQDLNALQLAIVDLIMTKPVAVGKAFFACNCYVCR
jgi:superfamily I DNA/RNA helicase